MRLVIGIVWGTRGINLGTADGAMEVTTVAIMVAMDGVVMMDGVTQTIIITIMDGAQVIIIVITMGGGQVEGITTDGVTMPAILTITMDGVLIITMGGALLCSLRKTMMDGEGISKVRLPSITTITTIMDGELLSISVGSRPRKMMMDGKGISIINPVPTTTTIIMDGAIRTLIPTVTITIIIIMGGVLVGEQYCYLFMIMLMLRF